MTPAEERAQDKRVRTPLSPSHYCRPEDVAGWTVERTPIGWDLRNPAGERVSPNCSPGDVRDSFRAFMAKVSQ